MNLQIRDPEVRKKAEKLARLRNTNLTEAVHDALEYRLNSLPRRSVSEVAAEIRAELKALSPGPGHEMTKEEIDAMWGQ